MFNTSNLHNRRNKDNVLWIGEGEGTTTTPVAPTTTTPLVPPPPPTPVAIPKELPPPTAAEPPKLIKRIKNNGSSNNISMMRWLWYILWVLILAIAIVAFVLSIVDYTRDTNLQGCVSDGSCLGGNASFNFLSAVHFNGTAASGISTINHISPDVMLNFQVNGGQNIAIVPGSSSITVETTNAIAVTSLAVSGATTLGTGTSCSQPLLPSCYNISSTSCSSPINVNCIQQALTLPSLIVTNLTVLGNATTIPSTNQTSAYIDYLTALNTIFEGPVTCSAPGEIAQTCINLAGYVCPSGQPLSESCIPDSQIFANATVTNLLTVNNVICNGPTLPSSCIGDLFDPASAVFYGTGTSTSNGGANSTTLGPYASTLGCTTCVSVGYNTVTHSGTQKNVGLGVNLNLGTAANFTVVIGSGSSAVGTGDIVIGTGSTGGTIGGNNIVVGTGATGGTGSNNVVFGEGASGGSNNCNVVAGCSAVAGYGQSVTIGHGANQNSLYSYGIAFGFMASSGGDNSISVGTSSAANNYASISQGLNSYSSGFGSISIGANSSTYASYSISFGPNSTDNSIVSAISMGYLASPVDSGHALAININSSSVSQSGGTLGITVNGNGYQLPLYASLYNSVATTGGTTVLSVTSAKKTTFTGSSTQTVTLPVVSTLTNGFELTIINLSTGGSVTVQSSGGNTVATLTSYGGTGTKANSGTFVCINSAGGTGAASWAYY